MHEDMLKFIPWEDVMKISGHYLASTAALRLLNILFISLMLREQNHDMKNKFQNVLDGLVSPENGSFVKHIIHWQFNMEPTRNTVNDIAAA
jgi:hypothetical protein